jgi:hypothetical protein
LNGGRRTEFAAAFFAQARSDWQTYEYLTRAPGLPRCHPLHYLQMACEKLAKAYRLRNPSANVDAIVTRHVGFAQFTNEFLRSPAILEDYKGQTARHKAVCRTSSTSARPLTSLEDRRRTREVPDPRTGFQRTKRPPRARRGRPIPRARGQLAAAVRW